MLVGFTYFFINPSRFSNKTVLCTTRSCDYCKRSMVFGVRCQKCKYVKLNSSNEESVLK